MPFEEVTELVKELVCKTNTVEILMGSNPIFLLLILFKGHWVKINE